MFVNHRERSYLYLLIHRMLHLYPWPPDTGMRCLTGNGYWDSCHPDLVSRTCSTNSGNPWDRTQRWVAINCAVMAIGRVVICTLFIVVISMHRGQLHAQKSALCTGVTPKMWHFPSYWGGGMWSRLLQRLECLRMYKNMALLCSAGILWNTLIQAWLSIDN